MVHFDCVCLHNNVDRKWLYLLSRRFVCGSVICCPLKICSFRLRYQERRCDEMEPDLIENNEESTDTPHHFRNERPI